MKIQQTYYAPYWVHRDGQLDVGRPTDEFPSFKAAAKDARYAARDNHTDYGVAVFRPKLHSLMPKPEKAKKRSPR